MIYYLLLYPRIIAAPHQGTLKVDKIDLNVLRLF